MDYVFVDDSAIALGGTALTLEAIIEPIQDRVEFVKTSDLTPQHLQFKKPKVWILGNITALTAEANKAKTNLSRNNNNFSRGIKNLESAT